MPSLVDVVNDSLAQIGEGNIAALDDDSVKAQICNTHLTIILRAMLFDHKWNFAYTRVPLAADAATPVSGFTYQYTLPGDYLRIWGIGDDVRRNGAPDGNAVWKVEKGKVLTDSASPLILHYDAYIDDPNKWGGGFTMALSTLLASRLAGSIAHDAGMAQAKLKEYYEVHLPNALAGDGQEQSIDVYESPDLIEVRDG